MLASTSVRLQVSSWHHKGCAWCLPERRRCVCAQSRGSSGESLEPRNDFFAAPTTMQPLRYGSESRSDDSCNYHSTVDARRAGGAGTIGSMSYNVNGGCNGVDKGGQKPAVIYDAACPTCLIAHPNNQQHRSRTMRGDVAASTCVIPHMSRRGRHARRSPVATS